jgi:hypothetical protein
LGHKFFEGHEKLHFLWWMYLNRFVKRVLFKKMFKIAHFFKLEMTKSWLFSGCSLLYIHERISLYCQDQKMAGFLLNKEMDTSLERYFRDLHIDPTTGALF